METLNQQLQKADRLAAITQRIGFVMWQLHELEGVAAQYFVLLAQAKKEMGLAAGNALVEKAQNKTFGATIHQIAKAGLLSSGLELRFNNLLSERNWLVHKSRRTSRNAIHSDSAAQKILLQLDSMADESNALLREIGVLVERNVKEHGVTEKYIEETANQLLEQWHASDAI